MHAGLHATIDDEVSRTTEKQEALQSRLSQVRSDKRPVCIIITTHLREPGSAALAGERCVVVQTEVEVSSLTKQSELATSRAELAIKRAEAAETRAEAAETRLQQTDFELQSLERRNSSLTLELDNVRKEQRSQETRSQRELDAAGEMAKAKEQARSAEERASAANAAALEANQRCAARACNALCMPLTHRVIAMHLRCGEAEHKAGQALKELQEAEARMAVLREDCSAARAKYSAAEARAMEAEARVSLEARYADLCARG